MKTYIQIFIIVLFSTILFSCSTTQTFTVVGQPGTEIYSPSMKNMGVVDNSGKVKIRISSDAYYAYLLSRDAKSNVLVPFALDYKNKSYTGTSVQKGIGYGIASIGASLALVGGIALAVGGEGIDGGSMLGIGGGSILAGLALGCSANNRSQQTQYEHKFKYLSTQTTNQNFKFVPITDTGYIKNQAVKDSPLQAEDTSVATKKLSGKTSTVKSRSTKSKRTLKDFGKLLAGTYVGNGALSQNDSKVEDYKNVKVTLQRIDNSNVYVEVYEGGETFFSGKSQYSIKKTERGSYVLTLKGISSAVINIDAAGHLTYYHPKVNIDGEIYTLEISAKK